MSASKIRFMLGDTDFPPGPTQGGSTTTSTLGNGVSLVCDALKKHLKELAIVNVAAFKASTIDDIEIKNEQLLSKNDNTKRISLGELVSLSGKEQVEIIQESGRAAAEAQKYAMNSFSAHFVKVHVDPATGSVKLKEIIATGDGGKIISEKTARSQMIGGAVGGIGMALTEEVFIDHSTGKYINDNLGSYHVPLHTDVPHIDAWFPNKPDPIINATGAKGVGEIALVGFAAAVANAVFNATGKRVYRLPIKPEDLIS